MKIIILGAGQVGTSVAANLVSEANDITVVDQDPALLRELQDRFDLRTILGQAAHPDVLLRAGAEDADMIIAVTNPRSSISGRPSWRSCSLSPASPSCTS